MKQIEKHICFTFVRTCEIDQSSNETHATYTPRKKTRIVRKKVRKKARNKRSERKKSTQQT